MLPTLMRLKLTGVYVVEICALPSKTSKMFNVTSEELLKRHKSILWSSSWALTAWHRKRGLVQEIEGTHCHWVIALSAECWRPQWWLGALCHKVYTMRCYAVNDITEMCTLDAKVADNKLKKANIDAGQKVLHKDVLSQLFLTLIEYWSVVTTN